MAKTLRGRELIEDPRKSRVWVAKVPFDISAEFIPRLLKRPDADVPDSARRKSPSHPHLEAIITAVR